MNFNSAREWMVKNQSRLILAGVGAVLVGVGVFWWNSDLGDTQVKILSEEYQVEEVSTNSLIVDVEGAVVRPGVYEMKTGQRMDDAIKKAGGFSKEANFDWVEQNLNRSVKLSDGMKIYIPRTEENTNESSVTLQGLININQASESELDTLPGIGPVTAAKIVSERPYTQTDELLTKKVVSQKVWDQIKEKVSVW